MEGYFWKTLLVLGALSASGRGEPSHKPLTYQKALELGVANYNNKAGEDSLYQLLEAVPQPEWDPNSEGTQELKFTIKETVCPVEEGRALEECDFKEDGVVRECTGNYFLGEKPPLAFVTCEAVEGIEEEEEEKEKKDEDEEEDRSRRRKLRRRPSRKDQPERFKKLKKLFKKIKKGTKKGIKRVTKTGAQIFFKKQILGKIAG